MKSSHRAGDGGQCVEVAPTDALVHVRDSRRTTGPFLTVARPQWTAFLRIAAGTIEL
ncbi:DUF397 domain-containing protein [Streptomyces sp. NPDC056347]|uniref:DUF397 domain-containing protein n=1 Tax=Streptomyces sp. NPDC056347 TaxID=3345790 RepID=UPI0035D9EC44